MNGDERQLSYGQRLVAKLLESGCPEQYVEVAREFMKAEYEEKKKYIEQNQGILSFGKYKGKNVREVYKLDPTYCQWLLDKSSKFLRDDIKAILNELLTVK